MRDAAVAARHRIAAVEPLAESEGRAADRDLGPTLHRCGRENGAQHLELRQVDALVAAKEPRPGAAGEDHAPASDAALLGDDARDLARRPCRGRAQRNSRRFSPPAAVQLRRSPAPPYAAPHAHRSASSRRRRSGAPCPGGGRRARRASTMREVIWNGRASSSQAFCLAISFSEIAKIEDAATAKPRSRPRKPRSSRPRVAGSRGREGSRQGRAPWPAPRPSCVPTTLRPTYPFSQSRDVDAAPAKEERRRHSDDAAADHHDIGARRKGAIGLDPVDSRHHDGLFPAERDRQTRTQFCDQRSFRPTASFSPTMVSYAMSKTTPARPNRGTPRSTTIFVVGRDRFAHIGAVEGIELNDEMRAAFDQFDREGLSPEERRRAILRRFTPSRS